MATIQSRVFLNGLALFSLTDFAATYVSTISLWAAKYVDINGHRARFCALNRQKSSSVAVF